MKSKIFWQGALHALGVGAYVLLVATILNKGKEWFANVRGVFAPAMILLLLVFSAAVVGSLIFLVPALWGVSGKKQEGLRLLIATLGWLAVLVIVSFIALAVFS